MCIKIDKILVKKCASKIEILHLGTNQNRALEFGRFMLEKGANPIVGQNEGEDHEIYQDFYKHKTKISRQEYEKLRAIINRGDINALEQDLENNVTVQCGMIKKYFFKQNLEGQSFLSKFVQWGTYN